MEKNPKKKFKSIKGSSQRKAILRKLNKKFIEIFTNGFDTTESIRQTLDAIQNGNLSINAYKGFEVKTKITVWKSIDASVGQYTTTCLKCNRTWYENCSYGSGESKEVWCGVLLQALDIAKNDPENVIINLMEKIF